MVLELKQYDLNAVAAVLEACVRFTLRREKVQKMRRNRGK